MAVDPNKLTIKSQEAVRQAQQLAQARNHQMVEPPHLLYALLSDPEGVVYPLLQRLGQSPRALRDRVEELLDRIPKVYGPAGDELYLGGPRGRSSSGRSRRRRGCRTTMSPPSTCCWRPSRCPARCRRSCGRPGWIARRS